MLSALEVSVDTFSYRANELLETRKYLPRPYPHGSSSPSLNQESSHDLSRFQASWAVLNNDFLLSWLKAAFWHNQTTCTAYYLRDCVQVGDLYSLGTLIVTHSVVQPNDSVAVSGFPGV